MLKNNRQMKKNHFKNEWGPIKLTSISNRIVVIVSVHKQFTFLCITVIMIVLRDIELRRNKRDKKCVANYVQDSNEYVKNGSPRVNDRSEKANSINPLQSK